MSNKTLALILQRAASVERWAELRGSVVKDSAPVLFDAATEDFGSWANGLAAALHSVCHKKSTPEARTAPAAVEPVHDRVLQDGWDGPIFMVGSDRSVFHIKGDELPTVHRTPAPMVPFEPRGEPLTIELAVANPFEGMLVVVSETGLACTVDGRIVPHAKGVLRRAPDMAAVASDGRIVAVVDRVALRRGKRFVHVTVTGKIKASAVSDFGRGPDRDGIQALLLGETDAIVSVFSQPDPEATFFCANLAGNGIHFLASDVRTMGLKAQGVRAMELNDDFDAICGAFCTAGCEQVLVLSAQGHGKRVSLGDFRVQGRGGQGMILMRPPAGDELVAVVPIASLDNDVLIASAGGRVLRLAVNAVPLLDRSAKGVKVVAVASDDRISTTCPLPGSGPMA
jgi:hypothetical protein